MKELYGFAVDITFRNVTVASDNKPCPLHLGTATQIGILELSGVFLEVLTFSADLIIERNEIAIILVISEIDGRSQKICFTYKMTVLQIRKRKKK